MIRNCKESCLARSASESEPKRRCPDQVRDKEPDRHPDEIADGEDIQQRSFRLACGTLRHCDSEAADQPGRHICLHSLPSQNLLFNVSRYPADLEGKVFLLQYQARVTAPRLRSFSNATTRSGDNTCNATPPASSFEVWPCRPHISVAHAS